MKQLEDGQCIPKHEVFIGQRVWYGRLYLTRSYKKSKDFLLPIPVTVKTRDFMLVDICNKKSIHSPSYFYGYEGFSFFKNKADLILSWNSQVTDTIRDIREQAERVRGAYSRGGYYYEMITKRKGIPSSVDGKMVSQKELDDGSIKKFYFESSKKVLYGTELPLGIRGTFNTFILPGQDELGDSLMNSVFPSFEDGCFYYSKYGIPQILEIIDSWEASAVRRTEALYI